MREKRERSEDLIASRVLVLCSMSVPVLFILPFTLNGSTEERYLQKEQEQETVLAVICNQVSPDSQTELP